MSPLGRSSRSGVWGARTCGKAGASWHESGIHVPRAWHAVCGFGDTRMQRPLRRDQESVQWPHTAMATARTWGGRHSASLAACLPRSPTGRGRYLWSAGEHGSEPVGPSLWPPGLTGARIAMSPASRTGRARLALTGCGTLIVRRAWPHVCACPRISEGDGRAREAWIDRIFRPGTHGYNVGFVMGVHLTRP